MTPTEALTREVLELIKERQPEIDHGIREMVITVKFSPESVIPRVFDSIERERRKAPRVPNSGHVQGRGSSRSSL